MKWCDRCGQSLHLSQLGAFPVLQLVVVLVVTEVKQRGDLGGLGHSWW